MLDTQRSSLDVEARAREARLALLVRLAALGAHEVVEPRAPGLEPDAARDVHDGEVHPRGGVADGGHVLGGTLVVHELRDGVALLGFERCFDEGDGEAGLEMPAVN